MRTPIALPAPTIQLVRRFWLKVDVRGLHECHPWLGAITNHGYGNFRVRDRSYQAHRLAYYWTDGIDPGGLVVDHTCHNTSDCVGGTECPHRRCMNYEHLEAITEGANILRGRAPSALHARATHCPAGHPYDTQNTLIYDGRRNCKTCRNQANRERYRKLAAWKAGR